MAKFRIPFDCLPRAGLPAAIDTSPSEWLRSGVNPTVAADLAGEAGQTFRAEWVWTDGRRLKFIGSGLRVSYSAGDVGASVACRLISGDLAVTTLMSRLATPGEPAAVGGTMHAALSNGQCVTYNKVYFRQLASMAVGTSGWIYDVDFISAPNSLLQR